MPPAGGDATGDLAPPSSSPSAYDLSLLVGLAAALVIFVAVVGVLLAMVCKGGCGGGCCHGLRRRRQLVAGYSRTRSGKFLFKISYVFNLIRSVNQVLVRCYYLFDVLLQ